MGPLKFGGERWTFTARFLKFHCFHKSPELESTKSHHPSGPGTYLTMEEETPSFTADVTLIRQAIISEVAPGPPKLVLPDFLQ